MEGRREKDGRNKEERQTNREWKLIKRNDQRRKKREWKK
jgi:hypothetical protein